MYLQEGKGDRNLGTTTTEATESCYQAGMLWPREASGCTFQASSFRCSDLKFSWEIASPLEAPQDLTLNFVGRASSRLNC